MYMYWNLKINLRSWVKIIAPFSTEPARWKAVFEPAAIICDYTQLIMSSAKLIK